MREVLRYLPLSNPRFQLLALLSLHIRNRPGVAMDTLISELPGIDPPSPPPPQRRPGEPKPHHQAHEKRTHECRRKQHRHNVTKFVNKPPDPLYYFEDGLRKVYPYYFTFNTFCKERWRGKSLLEVFSTEFRDRPVEYYEAAIAAGTVCVMATDKRTVLAGAPMRAGLDTIVSNGDMISHTMHRHEPPVTGQPIGIVYEDDDIIAISKPAGVPVHPTGRYNYNSITEIMKHERGPDFVPMPCNRLDRLTSGLMFIAKTRDAADRFMNQLRERTIRKQYVARVKGEFPEYAPPPSLGSVASCRCHSVVGY
jgi:tRNA pseudouridine synthase 9